MLEINGSAQPVTLFKSSRFPLKLQCRLKDLLVLFVWICYSSDKYLWSSRRDILQFQWQFQWKTAWCAGLKQKSDRMSTAIQI